MGVLKIGVIAVGYNCDKFFPQVLAAWSYLKKGLVSEWGQRLVEPDPRFDIKIAFTTALFKEYAELGGTYQNEATEKYLKTFVDSGVIDSASIVKTPIVDFQARNVAWNYLKQFDLDLVWQLDADEIYAVSDILNALEFIQKNPWVDWYRVNFKNFVGDTQHYIEGFCPPRIHWVKKNGGLKEWYWDNDVIYANGRKSVECSNLAIPPNKTFVPHFSWCGSDDFLEKKVKYQHKVLGCCSYRINPETRKLEFDKDYFAKIGAPVPELKHINA